MSDKKTTQDSNEEAMNFRAEIQKAKEALALSNANKEAHEKITLKNVPVFIPQEVLDKMPEETQDFLLNRSKEHQEVLSEAMKSPHIRIGDVDSMLTQERWSGHGGFDTSKWDKTLKVWDLLKDKIVASGDSNVHEIETLQAALNAMQRVTKHHKNYLNYGSDDHKKAGQVFSDEFFPKNLRDDAFLSKYFATLAAAVNVGSKRPIYNDREMRAGWLDDFIPFMFASAVWHRTGYPLFNLAPDFFHSIAVTDFSDMGPEGNDAHVKIPFDAFLLRLPENHLFTTQYMFVYRAWRAYESPDTPGEFRTKWRYRIAIPGDDKSFDRTTFTEWDDGTTFAQFLDDARDDGSEAGIPDPVVDRLILARRVLANFLLYISNAGGLPPQGTKRIGPDVPVEREHKELPRFRVGRPIRIAPKLRETVKAVTLSEARTGWTLAHRFLCRGHWKRQFFGKNRAERKLIWIQPYWKGPKDINDALERKFVVDADLEE